MKKLRDPDFAFARKLYQWSERLIPSDLEWLGRVLLKVVRTRLKRRRVLPNRAPRTNPATPVGPFKTTRESQCGDLLIYVPRGPDSRLIDDITGKHGYSHVTVDCGEIDLPSGAPVMIESMVGQVVKRRFLDEYGPRPFIRIPLAKAGVDPVQFCDCIKSKLGEPYDSLEVLTWGEIDDPARQICTDLVVNCFPENMRQDIAERQRLGKFPRFAVSVHSRRGVHPVREFVTPNGFAIYFGAPKGKEVHKPDQLVSPHIGSRMTALPSMKMYWGLLLLVLAGTGMMIWIQRKQIKFA